MKNLEQVSVSLRKHVLALTNLQTTSDGIHLPVHLNAAYINSNPIMPDPQIHYHLFHLVAYLVQDALLRASAGQGSRRPSIRKIMEICAGLEQSPERRAPA